MSSSPGGSDLALELEEVSLADPSAEMREDGLHVVFPAGDGESFRCQPDFCGLDFRAQALSDEWRDDKQPASSLRIVIRRVVAGSLAAQLNIVGPGMVLESVQGEPVAGLSLGDCFNLLEQASPPVRLVFAADGLPDVVPVETPRDTYGFPFAVGRMTQSGYFKTTPRTHIEIDQEIQSRVVSKKAKKLAISQEKRWERWLAAASGASFETPTAALKISCLGVPPGMRSEVWCALAGTVQLRATAEAAGHSYTIWAAEPEQPLASLAAAGFAADEDENLYQIEKDISRTFPSHRLFDRSSSGTGMGGIGIGVLRRILRAFVRRNPDIGYVQSMNYIAATIIITMIPDDCHDVRKEEAAFWLFSAIVEGALPDYYSASLFGVQRDTMVMSAALMRA